MTTEPTLETQLQQAEQRIRQLEAALMRRTALLEQKQSELASIQASKLYRLAHGGQKAFNRLFPIHSRRRAKAKWLLRSAFDAGAWLFQARRGHQGPPPEARYLSEATPAEEYRRWIARYEPDRTALTAQRQQAWAHPPLISVVVPVYRPPARYFEAMIQSVVGQTYPHWELILADATPPGEESLRDILQRAVQLDSRIRWHPLTENLGIAGNTNAGIQRARGTLISFLDHDDTLAPFALFEVARAHQKNPEADFFYSDEDKLDSAGERCEPYFKPDWSPETLRSRNYICHLTTLHRELLTRLGGLRSGFDGAQDYDLVLRASEVARRIVHIPAVLYHWRMHEASTASNKDSKSYAFEHGRLALTEHLQRLGIDASAHHGATLGMYQVVYHLRTQPLLSIIIPNKDHPELLARCVDSLEQSSYANYELIIIENGSTRPETFAYYRTLESRPQVRMLSWSQPFNYAAVNNFAARQARGELLLFLNNDVESINPDGIEALVKLAVQPGVGAVGAKLYYADDTIQHAGIIVGLGGVAGHGHLNFPRSAAGYMQKLLHTQNVSAVTGACLLTRKSIFEAVGGFDEGFVLAFNDVDLCLQILQQGYRIVWTPDAELYHYESKTRGPEDTDEKQARFRREYELFHLKWGDFLKKGDPYYNPHFRLDRADYALRLA